MIEHEHEWVAPGHTLLWGCAICGELTMTITGMETVEASMRRIREDELGKERTDEMYAEAEAIIRGEKPMPEFPRIQVDGIGVLQHETRWKARA